MNAAAAELAIRGIQLMELQVELARLRCVPCLCLGIVRRCRFCGQLHRRQRPVHVSLQFARVRHAGVRRRVGPQRHHLVERVERRRVLPKLNLRVAHHAIVPRIIRPQIA